MIRAIDPIIRAIDPMIRAEELTKKIESTTDSLVILDNITLEIQLGQKVAIIGRSGAGKTTLLNILAGLDLPTSGQIIVGGVDFTKLAEEQRTCLRGRNIGFIFQSFYLMHNLTALGNVKLVLEIHNWQQDIEQTAVASLQAVGLDDRLHHYPRHLSRGEQQRVAIARAFVMSPTILFADEPTGSLDQVTGEKIIELLFSLNKTHNTTLITVTHDIELARLSDRVIELDKGKIKGC